jgi:DNA polymerase-3 subunit alpha
MSVDILQDQRCSEIISKLEQKGISSSDMDRCIEEMRIMSMHDGLGKGDILDDFIEIRNRIGNNASTHNTINSLTAYLLGMTTKTPDGDMSNFIPVRRIFARAGFPDIDADFDNERRQEVYNYIIEKYGREYVGNIGTYQTLKMRSYVTRAAKALDIADSFHQGKEEFVTKNNELVRRMIDSLPEQRGAILKIHDDEGEEHEIKSVRDATEHCGDFAEWMHKHPEIIRHSEAIEGLCSSYGVHAAGIVISKVPLSEIAPLRGTGKSEGEHGVSFATQFAYEDLESLGIIKFDILSVSTLSVISECLKLIEIRHGLKIDIENLPLDDADTFRLYRTGELAGVFQCEEKGMQKTMVQMVVDSYKDICAGIALFRPGPMASIPKYCARKRGNERIDYMHSSLEPLLKRWLDKTYGILVYQEQVMQICNSVANFSIADGYQVIKAVGKKKFDLLKKFKSRFVAGAKNNAVPEKIAERFWDEFIMPFAQYGFNASHSACYGLISYQTAYLKAHFAAEFICSYLNVEIKKKDWDRVVILEKEAQRLGIAIAPRHINTAGVFYSLKTVSHPLQGDSHVLIPPIICKGMRFSAAEDIVSKSPYKSFEDLCNKVDTSVVDSETIEAMRIAGFFKVTSNPVEKFIFLRDSIKKARKKGFASTDMFG